MSYLEELLPEFRKGAKIRCSNWEKDKYIQKKGGLVATDNDILCDLSASDIFQTGGNFTKSLLTGTTSSRTSAYAGFGMQTNQIKGQVF